ncbi:hypothetical protein MMC10_008328 [Thelotrema lepadinum]|nr:hypothetical protein [Thelotrema lepadinum]
MSSWRSYLPGRYSPFYSQHGPTTRPTVTEDDYHYLGPEDIVDPPRDPHHSHLSRHTSRTDADNPDVPDILVLKHRGTTYPLHFPAYSIGEGVLRVGQLRRYAADKTGTSDPRRIKLLYKGKQLKDDAVACREEGLKQNSELMCVVSEVPVTSRRDTSESSADESDLVSGDREGPRVDVDGTIIGGPPPKKRNGQRSGSKKVSRISDRDDRYYGGSDHGSSAHSGRSSAPHLPSTSNHHAPAPSSIPREKDRDQSYRAPPPAPAHEPKRASPPEQHPSPKPVQTGPKGPMDKLEEVASKFHTTFLPMCVQFTNNPPKDPKVREQEYMKLSESILAQIIFKLDEVETEGNEEARNRRRALVKETQAVLNGLDALQKGGKKTG